MPEPNWIDRYPYILALLQQDPEEELLYAAEARPRQAGGLADLHLVPSQPTAARDQVPAAREVDWWRHGLPADFVEEEEAP